MGSVTARVTDSRGTSVSATATYAVGATAPMAVGWCPGPRSGESAVAATLRNLADYPNTGAVAVFMQVGEGLPASAWTSTSHELAKIPTSVRVILVSYKDAGVDVAAFVAAWKAKGHTGILVIVPFHEPEQQTAGDPTISQFRAEWTRLRQYKPLLVANAGRLLFGTCHTLQWCRRVSSPGGSRVNDWRDWFPDHEADLVGVVTGDWYPYDPVTHKFKPNFYEAPDKALAIMLEIRDAVAAMPKRNGLLPLLGVRESNHVRVTLANGFPSDLDVDGTKCADWMSRMFAEAEKNKFLTWTWFHKGGGDLTKPGADRREPEYQALKAKILEAS